MNEDELAYYRAVEDLFARLRGTPFLFTPKDFALLREWWKEGVPLAAVVSGIGEVFERRREHDEDPVSSLSYCRHAVRRRAKQLAEAAVGAARSAPQPIADVKACRDGLRAEVSATAKRWEAVPVWASLLGDLVAALETIPVGLAPELFDETLGRLEVTVLSALASSAPEPWRERLAAAVDGEVGGLELDSEVRERTARAIRLKLVREMVGLPRLECHAVDR
jgi:hypothetical protein